MSAKLTGSLSVPLSALAMRAHNPARAEDDDHALTPSFKWKAPSDVSIDFRLELKFPPTIDNADVPDLTAKPASRLLANHGSAGSQYFDVLDVADEQWIEWKLSGEQSDDRVVEVTWDMSDERWVFHRLRSDKSEGNHITVVNDLIRCIQHSIDRQTVGYSSRPHFHLATPQPSDDVGCA